MNMQAMLKQAQKMQKDMLNTQDEINKKVFEYSSGIVSAKMTFSCYFTGFSCSISSSTSK